MSIELTKWHLSRKVPVFLKVQAILDSSEEHTVEDMKAILGELKLYSEQIDEMIQKIQAITHEKWLKVMLKED